MEWIRSPEEKDGYMFDFMSFHKAIDVVLVITIIQMIPMLVMAWSAVVALYGGTKKRIIPGPECMKKTNNFRWMTKKSKKRGGYLNPSSFSNLEALL